MASSRSRSTTNVAVISIAGILGVLLLCILLFGPHRYRYLSPYVPIRDLASTPEKFADKDVRISGKVTGVLSLPIGPKFYYVQDATGEIQVRTDQTAPFQGEIVHVQGRLESLFNFPQHTVGLHLHEASRW